MEDKKEMTELERKEKEEQKRKLKEEIEAWKNEYLYDEDIVIVDGIPECRLGY